MIKKCKNIISLISLVALLFVGNPINIRAIDNIDIDTYGINTTIKSIKYDFNNNSSKVNEFSMKIPKGVSIRNVSLGVGNVVEYSYDKNTQMLTVKVDNGKENKTYNDYQSSKYVSDWDLSSTNSFSSYYYYSDSSGYSGSIYKDGTSYVYSGSYTAAQEKTVTDYELSTGPNFSYSSSIYYSSGGYTGYLYKSGSPTYYSGSTSSKTVSGQNATTRSYDVKKNDSNDSGNGSIIESNVLSMAMRNNGWSYSDKYSYSDSSGYSGSLSANYSTRMTGAVSVSEYPLLPTGKWRGSVEVTRSFSGTVTADTRTMKQSYSGTVTKPAVDTRTWRQDYYGKVYKGGYDYSYDYAILIEYESDVLDVNITPSQTTWTNEDIVLTVNSGSNFFKSIKAITSSLSQTEYNQRPVTYRVTSNGTYSFKAFDTIGNEVSNSYTVSNIDKASPIVNYSLSPTTSWTRDEITVNINAIDTLSGVDYIILPNNNIVYDTKVSVTVSKNSSLKFIVVDKANNRTTLIINVSNIDNEGPIINYEKRFENNVGYIDLNVVDLGSGLDSVILPNGEKTLNGELTYTVNNNGFYQVSASDKLGNTSTIIIGFDKISTGDVISGIDRIEYKLEGATTKDWTIYNGPFYIQNEGITNIVAKAYDKAGNVSKEVYSQVKIDKSSPINNEVKIELIF